MLDYPVVDIAIQSQFLTENNNTHTKPNTFVPLIMYLLFSHRLCLVVKTIPCCSKCSILDQTNHPDFERILKSSSPDLYHNPSCYQVHSRKKTSNQYTMITFNIVQLHVFYKLTLKVSYTIL